MVSYNNAGKIFRFPFNDLHGFKDYVAFVQTYLPDRFHPRAHYGPDEQWTMEHAILGLRVGLRMAIDEKGDNPVFAECLGLVDQAEAEYRNGQTREGFGTLERVQNLLDQVKTS